jgi:hypothetical protein
MIIIRADSVGSTKLIQVAPGKKKTGPATRKETKNPTRHGNADRILPKVRKSGGSMLQRRELTQGEGKKKVNSGLTEPLFELPLLDSVLAQ